MQTNPEIKWVKGLQPRVTCIFGRVDKPELPFDDIRVRRALHMGIDFQALKDDFYGGNAEIISFPVHSTVKAAYTPLEELPESSREMFEYNPDKAKQLLAEAGYPDGFKTTVLTQQRWVDMLSIIKEYWAKIGVDMEMDVKTSSVYVRQKNNRQHAEMIAYDPTLAIPYKIVYTNPTNHGNCSMVDDPYLNEIEADLWSWELIGNQAKQDQLLKERALYVLEQAYVIQLPAAYAYNLWWPWVKNYYGENQIGYGRHFNYYKYIWIDQDLKKAMGY